MDSDNLNVFVLTTPELIVNYTLVHTITSTNRQVPFICLPLQSEFVNKTWGKSVLMLSFNNTNLLFSTTNDIEYSPFLAVLTINLF